MEAEVVAPFDFSLSWSPPFGTGAEVGSEKDDVGANDLKFEEPDMTEISDQRFPARAEEWLSWMEKRKKRRGEREGWKRELKWSDYQCWRWYRRRKLAA